MLNPSVRVTEHQGVLFAEFWDCLRLDPRPVAELRAALNQHLSQGLRPFLLVDLSGVGFAGSASLGGFVGMRKLGVRVVFYNVEPTVREVFRVTQLEGMFQFATDREAACALLDSNGANSALVPIVEGLAPGQEPPAPSAERLEPPRMPPPLRRKRLREG